MFLRAFYRLLRMPVNVNQWRMEIGNFYVIVFYVSKNLMVIAYILYAVLFKNIINLTFVFAFFFFSVFRKKVNIINIYLGGIPYWNILSSFMMNIWYYKYLLQLSGDIELNPCPKPNSCKSFSICPWNLNSITFLTTSSESHF